MEKNKKKSKKTKINEENLKLIMPNKKITIIGICLGVIIALLGIVSVYNKNTNIDYSKSYLVTKNIAKEVNCDNVSEAINKEQAFVLVTNYNDESEYNLEKDLKSVIGKYKLSNNFYVFPQNHNCGTISDIQSGTLGEILKLKESINTMPTILYYKNGEFVDYVKREDAKMIEAADFVQLLDIYEITK